MSRQTADNFLGTDRFVIEQRLGSGGFGVVYQAYDQHRQVQVALKVLNQALSQENAKALYSFKQEFRSLTDITHRNLVLLYELISDGDLWFFTMELVNGINFLEYVFGNEQVQTEDLSEKIFEMTTVRPNPESITQQPTLDSSSPDNNLVYPVKINDAAKSGYKIERLKPAFIQLATGLCALHDAGKLHRDIKPSNVLVTPDERVVILDFGLVTELASRYDVQDYDDISGTPTHMSPEQAQGFYVTPASDWYSVGVMLYQALTGQLPFNGTIIEMLNNKILKDPTPPIELVPTLPPDLSDFCLRLLHRDPEYRATGKELLNYLGANQLEISDISGMSMATAGVQTSLIGREQHFSELRRALATLAEKRALTVCVEGFSGMGKSLLINHFLNELAIDQKTVVLSGRCYEREAVPYKAFDSLIDELSYYLISLDEAEVEPLMPHDIQALAKLFPVLRQVRAVTRGQRQVLEIADSQELRRRAFGALRELLKRISAVRSLVLFIDDLQWGDVDSISLLNELLFPPDPPALLLIVSYRSEEAANPLLQSFLAMLKAIVELREIKVGELSPVDAKQLALTLLGNKDMAAQAEVIARESGGNPFFIDALVKYLQTDTQMVLGNLSASDNQLNLNNVIQMRVSKLPEQARRLLQVIAVAGQPIELAMAKSAAKVFSDVPGILAILRANHFVRTQGVRDEDKIESYHDRIRETIATELPAELLKQYHQNLALVYEAAKDPDPELLANHFYKAGDNDKAANYAVAAATKAAEALAFDHAAQLYRLSLEIKPRTIEEAQPLRVKLGDALVNAGQSVAAAEVYLSAVEGATAAEAVELKRRAAEQLLRAGHIEQALEILHVVLESLGIKLAKTPLRAAISLVARRIKVWFRGLDYQERDASEISADELLRLDTYFTVAFGLGMVDNIRGADFQTLHLLHALKVGEPYRLVRAIACEAAYSSRSGGASRVRTNKLIEMSTAMARRINHPHALGLTALYAGFTALLQGRWRNASDLCKEATQVLRNSCTGVDWEIDTAQLFYLRGLVFGGEYNEIASCFPIILKEAQERGDLYAVTNLMTRVSYISRLVANEPLLARQESQQALARWSQRGFFIQHFFTFVGELEIALYCGDSDLAQELIKQQWTRLRRSFLLQIQLFRIEALHLRARAALASAATAANPKPWLATAAKDAKKIEREQMAWGNALALLIRAGIASIEQNPEDAIRLLAEAEAGFQATDMSQFQMASRTRRGQLMGGNKGQELIESAENWMTAQKVKEPSLISNLLAPGKWSIK